MWASDIIVMQIYIKISKCDSVLKKKHFQVLKIYDEEENTSVLNNSWLISCTRSLFLVLQYVCLT